MKLSNRTKYHIQVILGLIFWLGMLYGTARAVLPFWSNQVLPLPCGIMLLLIVGIGILRWVIASHYKESLLNENHK